MISNSKAKDMGFLLAGVGQHSACVPIARQAAARSLRRGGGAAQAWRSSRRRIPAMPHTLPPLARFLGLAGLLPFLACAAAALLTEGYQRGLATQALAAYGAVILSFLGGVHWGFALGGTKQPEAEAFRFIGGVAPSLLAWPALLLPGTLSCLVLALGLGVLLVVEEWALRQGWTPAPYQGLRRLLTAVAGTCLLVVAVAGLG
jgi:hypothetical protein